MLKEIVNGDNRVHEMLVKNMESSNSYELVIGSVTLDELVQD